MRRRSPIPISNRFPSLFAVAPGHSSHNVYNSKLTVYRSIKKLDGRMSNESQNTPNKSESDPWQDQKISLQDIVLSNSWAVQAILNYLEEIDPNARERIWAHYELMKKQQEAAQKSKNGEGRSNESIEDGEE